MSLDRRTHLRHVIPDGPRDGRLYYHAYRAVAAIEGTEIAEGDFLIHVAYGAVGRSGAAGGVRGKMIRVPRSVFPAIAASIERLEFVEDSWGGEGGRSGLHRYLSSHGATTGLENSAPLFIVRPWHSVSRPIRAGTDDGAIFELLADVGCRMPT